MEEIVPIEYAFVKRGAPVPHFLEIETSMASIKFYGMNAKNSKTSAVARSEKTFEPSGLWELIKTLKTPDQWCGLHLTLGAGVLTDLAPTDVIGRVCSPKLVEVINQFHPAVLWLPVRLQRDNTEYTYYFMHFLNLPDVMDESRTVYAGGSVFTPHISLEKAAHLPLICFRPLGSMTFVRGDVKDAIENAGCQGIHFEKIAAS